MSPTAFRSPGSAAFAVLLTLFSASGAFAAVTVRELSGQVRVREGSGAWRPLFRDATLNPGSEIETKRSSRCVLQFDDGSKVEVGPNGSFILDEAAPQKPAFMRFNLGSMRAWVTKALSQRFTVRTPTAVCSVRGTEFEVRVQDGGNTSVELMQGLLSVADQGGNEVLLKDGQRVDVDARGLGPVQGAQEHAAQSQEKLREALKREVGLDMTKEEVQAAAAIEQKSAIYKEGKALVDVNGHRVRLEDYIIRSGQNQFKLVVLNERVDRFDYFYYLGTFNKTLPDDISVALRQIRGQPDAPPEFFLTGFETGRSNTTDSVLETASGGHLVDVNNNGVASDNVLSAFDPKTDTVVDLNAGQPFYKTLFDAYSLKFNGVTHHAWSLNLGNQPLGAYVPTPGAGGFPVYDAANLTGAQNETTHLTFNDVTTIVAPPNCQTTDNCTHFPEQDKFHQIVYLENANGTVWEKFDNYIISNEGKVAQTSDFANLTTGADFKKILLEWNYQQIITASEFGGRKIDLVVSPKVLIESGLIP